MKKSYTTAFCGIISAISIIFLFCTAFFPFAEYALPCLAGAVLMVLVVEVGYKYAFVAFFAVSLISFFIVPSREVSVLFFLFFGYYPIVKSLLEKLKLRFLEWALKLLIFNVAMVSAYFLLINLFGLKDLLNEFGAFKFGIPGMLFLGNIVFIIYDIALTKAVSIYIYKLSPILKKRFKV